MRKEYHLTKLFQCLITVFSSEFRLLDPSVLYYNENCFYVSPHGNVHFWCRKQFNFSFQLVYGDGVKRMVRCKK